MVYTGVGARKTPQTVLDLMTEIGMYFGSYGWTLRSGGGDGADSAFEHGHDCMGGIKEIFLPCPDYRHHSSNLYIGSDNVETGKALSLAEQLWGKREDKLCEWNELSEFSRANFARDVFSICGVDLCLPTDLLICWTIDGEASGGAGFAIRIANYLTELTGYSIPIINLQKEAHRIAIKNILKGTDPAIVVKEMKR